MESSKKGLIVSIDTVKKPEGSNKVQELEAMEEALKKATQEAHNQRVALTGGVDLMQSSSKSNTSSKALSSLKKKQEDQ